MKTCVKSISRQIAGSVPDLDSSLPYFRYLDLYLYAAAMDHMTRHTPFLHQWNAVITNGDKFWLENLMQAADEKLIINELGPCCQSWQARMLASYQKRFFNFYMCLFYNASIHMHTKLIMQL